MAELKKPATHMRVFNMSSRLSGSGQSSWGMAGIKEQCTCLPHGIVEYDASTHTLRCIKCGHHPIHDRPEKRMFKRGD